MTDNITELAETLADLGEAISDSIPHSEPLNLNSGNWSFPGMTGEEIADRAYDLQEKITTLGSPKSDDQKEIIESYRKCIQFLIDNTVPQIAANSAAATWTILHTLDALDHAISPLLDRDPNIELIQKINKINQRLQSREHQLDQLDPKFDNLSDMVTRIENAFSSADRLPTDLKSLSDAQKNVETASSDVHAMRTKADERLNTIEKIAEKVKNYDKQAASVLSRCENTYAAATSVGLAAAFSERSKSVGTTVWVWTLGLVIALGIAGWLGFWRITELTDTLADNNASDLRTAMQFMLSALSVGAPIWFAWLATRQIGQRFRIAEDYAFKAAVSRAYEGYRKEAARIDEELEADLLRSALARLDEQPLRLVEHESPSSPLQELGNSEAIRRALSVVPDFTNQVKKLAQESLDKIPRGRTLEPKKETHANDASSDEDE